MRRPVPNDLGRRRRRPAGSVVDPLFALALTNDPSSVARSSSLDVILNVTFGMIASRPDSSIEPGFRASPRLPSFAPSFPD